METWRLGWAHPEGPGTWLAQLPTSRDAQGCMGSFGFGLPHMASAPCLCLRQGLGAQTSSLRQFFGFCPLPLTTMCSLCKTLLVFLSLRCYMGFCQPSKAFLASATPCGHAPCNLLVQFTAPFPGLQEPDGVEPRGSAPLTTSLLGTPLPLLAFC